MQNLPLIPKTTPDGENPILFSTCLLTRMRSSYISEWVPQGKNNNSTSAMTSLLLNCFPKIGPQTHNISPIQESTPEIHTLIIYLHVSPVIWDNEHPLILLFDDKSSRPICLTRPKVQRIPCLCFVRFAGWPQAAGC